MVRRHYPSVWERSWRHSLLLLLLLFSSYYTNAEFNYEVEKRVVERIDDFMDGPRTANGVVAKFRANGGFPNDLSPLDRDVYLRFAYSLVQEFGFDMIYVGLEDGTFIGHGIGWGTYREPGNGYPVNDPTMQHYFHACVDRQTGVDRNCTMQPGSKYIQCVRNCGLMKCADEETQQCSKVLAEYSGMVVTPAMMEDMDTEARHCFQRTSSTKWCRQYAVNEILEENEGIGFVPRTYYCHDSKGAFTQQPGQAVKGGFLALFDDPALQLGDCEFENGQTKVERWEEGPYAYCGVDEATGEPKICDNTFDGGYRSRDYDPRYRTWYLATKKLQLPNWSKPYPFFSNLDLGITYSHPIYSTDPDGRYIFDGVLAVDYTFVDIGKFLMEGYMDSDTIVLVYEEDEPNFVVATSTGRKAATKVLTTDESIPCPDDSTDTTECTVVRESMSNLNINLDPLDELLVRAYEEQRDQNYPRELLTVRSAARNRMRKRNNNNNGNAADNTLDSTLDSGNNDNFDLDDDAEEELFIVQSSYYRPGGDLNWIILVISPAGKGTADAVTVGNGLFGLVCVIATLGFLLCLAMFVLFYRQRHERAVILADWRFTSAFLLGCALLNISSFTMLGENTDALCMARMWSFHFLFALALSPLFVKVWRMWRMVGAPNRRPTIVNHTTAAVLSLPIVAVSTLILFIFSFVDPPRQEEVIDIEGGIVTQHVVCATNTDAFVIVITIYEAGLILIGCILAYVTRNLDSQFGEAKQLMFSMYNIGFIGTITTIIIYTMDIDATGEVMLRAIAIFWATVFSSAAFVLPRLMTVREERKRDSSIMKKGGSHKSSANTNRAKAGHRNSKVRFSMDDDKSSVASADNTNHAGHDSASGFGGSMVSGLSETQSMATTKQSNRSNRDFQPPPESVGNTSTTTALTPIDSSIHDEHKRRSIKISISDSVASGSGYSDSFVKGTGWTLFEPTDPNATLGRWSDAGTDDDEDEEGELKESDEPMRQQDIENSANTMDSLSQSQRPEHRPSMATIEEVEVSETMREDDTQREEDDHFSDDQANRPP